MSRVDSNLIIEAKTLYTDTVSYQYATSGGTNIFADRMVKVMKDGKRVALKTWSRDKTDLYSMQARRVYGNPLIPITMFFQSSLPVKYTETRILFGEAEMPQPFEGVLALKSNRDLWMGYDTKTKTLLVYWTEYENLRRQGRVYGIDGVGFSSWSNVSPE